MKQTQLKKHKIGEHGAVGFVTREGRICAECNEPIIEDPTLLKACEFVTSEKGKKIIQKKCKSYLDLSAKKANQMQRETITIAEGRKLVQKIQDKLEGKQTWEEDLDKLTIDACPHVDIKAIKDIFSQLQSSLKQKIREIKKYLKGKTMPVSTKDKLREMLNDVLEKIK